MLPLVLNIDGNNISIFGISLIVSLFIYIYIGWRYLRNELEPKTVFDILFLTIFYYIFFSRVIGILSNPGYYSQDLLRIFDIRDNNFSYIGFIIGLIISIITINNVTVKQHKNKREIFGHLFLTFIISALPLIIGNILSGRMLGIEVTSNIGTLYSDGIRRMPIGIFRLIFYFISLIIFIFLKKDKDKRLVNIIAVFFIGYSVFEFILNFFSKSFSASVFNIINTEQLFTVCIFLLGIFILVSTKWSRITYNNQIGSVRRTKEQLMNNTGAVDYSYSFKNMNISINQSELTIKEKFTIFINSLKRSFRK